MYSESKWDFSGLKALFLNCTLKKSPELSHTQGLIDISIAIMEKNGISTECLRPVDHDIATGVWPDMTEHGWESDNWPVFAEKVMAADILVLAHRSGWAKRRPSVRRSSSVFTRPPEISTSTVSTPTMAGLVAA
jgi:hypothetical protein